MKFTVYVTVEDTGFEVTGCYERYVPARTSGHPDDWEPSEPEEFDIESISVNGVNISEFLSEYYHGWITSWTLQELRAN